MKYDVFIRLGSVAPALPVSYPYKLTILTEGGEFVEQIVKSKSDLDLRKAVSIKLHKPNVLNQLLLDFKAQSGSSDKHDHRLLGLMEMLQDRGLLTLPAGPKSDWLDRKMDELGIKQSILRKDIRDWFENPDKNPTTAYDLNNSILTVKSVPGGRVVVLPTGHTVAYTKAKSIYWAMLGYDDPYTGTRITVGEYNGTTIWYTKHRLTVRSSGVTVGCQTVPRKAILELAEREGWAKSPAY